MENKKRGYIWKIDAGVKNVLGDPQLEITVRLMEYTDGKIRNLSSRLYNADQMADLVVEQTNWISKYGEKGELYNRHSIFIDTYKMELKEGAAADFADVVKRIANILKVKQFCWVLGTDRGWHNENSHEITGLKDALYHIRMAYKDEQWLRILAENKLSLAA